MVDSQCKSANIFYEWYIILIYYWMVFVSSISDTCARIWKLKPIPYVERNDYVAVVTGGGRGLGAHVVKKLISCGMTVVVGVRNLDRCKKLLEDAVKLPGKIDLQELDVSNMKSVKRFAKVVGEKYNKINILVNNAGIIYRDTEETDEGFEPILATNYLGHFLLSHLLLKNLEDAGKSSDLKSRIVNVSSCAHVAGTIDLEDIHMKNNYVRLGCYGRSKLAQLMFSRYLDILLKCSSYSVISIAVHPGIVASNMSDDWKDSWLPVTKTLRSEEEGARNVLFCCFDPNFKGGEYFFNDYEGYSTSESKNQIKQKRLFDYTCNMLDIKSLV